MKRAESWWVAAIVVMALVVAGPVGAQEYPNRPVRVLVGFAAGSGTDILARIVADELQTALKQPFVVENRPGASAQIAANTVAKAAPDGYTLFFTTNSALSVNPHVFKNLPYDPIADFTPIGGVGSFPWILAVGADVPVRTPRELVDYARANKGKVNFAYGTNAVRVPAEAINKLEKLEATGVPYKSSPDAMTDIIGGRVQFLVVDLAAAQTHLKSGRLRALAVTMNRRTSLAPQLPTIEESLGLTDFDLSAWAGLFGPANMPRSVVERLSGTLLELLARPEVAARIVNAGAEPRPSDSAALGALIKRELEAWGRKVALAGIQPE